MAIFKIGQKVVCKDDKLPNGISGVPRGVKAGEIYEVCGFDTCEFCGMKLVLLTGVDSGGRKECLCGEIPILPTNAFCEYRFEPLKYNTNKVSETDTITITDSVGNIL